MIACACAVSRIVVVRLNPGEDILLSLREAVQREQIRNAMILSGVGSLSRFRVHVVKTVHMPPGDVFFEGEGPFDILTLTGAVLDGRVHAHITFANTEKALGGHLEEGSRILTFGLATLAVVDGVDLTDWDRVGPL
jgi:predicted DNA-binding protein with PD1-like motif